MSAFWWFFLGWNLKSFHCDFMWSFSSGIGLDIFYAHLKKVLTILNIYEPYVNRVSFWNSLLNKAFVSNREVILGGEFNFSLGCAEVWGPKAILETLVSLFTNAFACHDMLDISPINISPTWRNKRTG